MTVLRLVMTPGLPGIVLCSSSSLSWAFVLDLEISGGSPTSASRMEEVSTEYLHVGTGSGGY